MSEEKKVFGIWKDSGDVQSCFILLWLRFRCIRTDKQTKVSKSHLTPLQQSLCAWSGPSSTRLLLHRTEKNTSSQQTGASSYCPRRRLADTVLQSMQLSRPPNCRTTYTNRGLGAVVTVEYCSQSCSGLLPYFGPAFFVRPCRHDVQMPP